MRHPALLILAALALMLGFLLRSRTARADDAPQAVASPADANLYTPAGPELEIDAAPDIALHDAKQSKDLHLRITYPKTGSNYPLIVFSHGAFGSKDGYQPLITYWAAHGYVCIQPTHGDSLSIIGFRGLLHKDEAFKNWSTRPLDIRLILDSLPQIIRKVPALQGKIDETRIAMAGHSFGAHTTMEIAGLDLVNPITGQHYAFADPRPKCFLMISPQGPGNLITEASYKPITRPAMIITGSNDVSIEKKPVEWRLKVYDLISSPEKYLVFVDKAYHGFGGISGRMRFPGSGPPDPHQVADVRAYSLAFFDAYLKHLAPARQYIHADNDHPADVTLHHP